MGQDVSVDNDDDFQQQFQRNPTALLRDMDSSQAESLRQRLRRESLRFLLLTAFFA